MILRLVRSGLARRGRPSGRPTGCGFCFQADLKVGLYEHRGAVASAFRRKILHKGAVACFQADLKVALYEHKPVLDTRPRLGYNVATCTQR